MTPPYLIKYIYSNGSDEVIRRGKKIYTLGKIEIIHQDQNADHIICRIKDDAYNSWYKVYISDFADPDGLSLRCTCPYNVGDICRHEAAALFFLQDIVDTLARKTEIDYDQTLTEVKMKNIIIRDLKRYSSAESFNFAEEYLRTKAANIISAAKEIVIAEIKEQDNTHRVVIKRINNQTFETSCDCTTESKFPLCRHKVIVFLQLLHSFGSEYFETIRDWDKDKNKLLAIYGYSLKDAIDDKFEFTYKDGKPFLRVLDPNIKRLESLLPDITPQKEIHKQRRFDESTVIVAGRKLGIVLSYDKNTYPYVKIHLVRGDVNEDESAFTSKIEVIDIQRFNDIKSLDDHDKALLYKVRKTSTEEVTKYLNRNSVFTGVWESIVQQHDEEFPEDTRQLMAEYLLPKFKDIFVHTAESYLTFYLPPGKTLTSKNIELANFSVNYIKPAFTIQLNEDNYDLICETETPLETYPLQENEFLSNFIFQIENQFFLWKSVNDILLADKFANGGRITYPKQEWGKVLEEFVLPLSQNHKIDFSAIHTEEIVEAEPALRIHLRENGDYLMFDLQFLYNDELVAPTAGDCIISAKDGIIKVINRNRLSENNLIGKITALHTSFVRYEKRNLLALKGKEVLKDNWFFLFLEKAKQLHVPVVGFENLKKFRFNKSKAQTQIFITSHTDWFDAQVDVRFGDQEITVDEIKKALANNQSLIPLKDGTLGVLPEEWIKKYSLLFQVGEASQKKIKLSKYHFGIIDELYELKNEDEINFELEDKFRRIKENHSIVPVTPPEQLKHILRPYQEFGLNWLNFLYDIGWNGILADDMGLGKTIQALSFLSHLKKIHKLRKAIVICPTSLLYNWENEIKKFTPEIKYYIHHGTNRFTDQLGDAETELIITTYGTVRSDIKRLIPIHFDYVILDESQAIKNPVSKITKAVTLLQSTGRLCLSGTPLQNNTFDVYAQMNFLNPGLLGTADWFKQNFAIPIDKMGEADKKLNLKKLIFPFILRRTKEQVAKDLPEKTESILYLQMGKKQRRIYDAYRNDFREKIMGSIEAQGIQRSQFTVLQGLMKLRQICDSPAILKDEEYPNHSVKIEELSKEINENAGNHKVLIFSQFLGMLSLIKKDLQQQNINFEYFDGSSSVQDRERAIHNFQHNENCRVFLISLKAGGVGLNLTAADYVYIVDPWWNPAVEQQAIDRTHRIGQTKNIFAYRMICKESVEDKIIELQKRKRLLASELISTESGFVKSLTKEDVEYLFS